jgi:exosome complex component RRP40
MESELVCVNSLGKKDGLGVLSNTGYVLTVPINIIRRILAPDSKLLECLGKKFKYEIAVGMNGRIWINSKSIETTITVVNILSQLENTPKSQYQQICDQIMEGWTQKHKK